MEGTEQVSPTREERGNRFAKLADNQVLAAADELGLQIDYPKSKWQALARVQRVRPGLSPGKLIRENILSTGRNSDATVFREALEKLENSAAGELQNADVDLEELNFSLVDEWHTSIRDRLQGKKYDVQAKQKTTGRFVTLETRRIKNIIKDKEMLKKRAGEIVEKRRQEALAKEAELQRAYEKVTISS